MHHRHFRLRPYCRYFFHNTSSHPSLPLVRSFHLPTLTTPTPQTLTSSSTLPYPAPSLFQLIADIESYPLFIPYVTGARTTAWSEADPLHGRRWARTAELRVGWGGFVDESFSSRVYCVPDRIVEAVSGRARSGIPREELGHYFVGRGEEGEREEEEGGVFERMRTRWELKELENGKGTYVRLEVDVCFASQVYAALCQAAGPKVAETMVRTFQKRAKAILGEAG